MELDPYDARWNKVKILHYAISHHSSWSSHCDYVLWIDADWTVLDMNWSIAGLVSANPDAHILTSAAPVSSSDPLPLTPSNIPSDYPEMVKSVAIAAQHLLPAIPQQTLSVEDRMIVADEIEHYLERMIAIAHPDQHPAIQQMAMHHLMQEGDMAYQELNNIAVAVICFERAVDIARAISPVFGAHHLIQPLTMLANIRALNRDFASALALYEEAATYGRRQWGPWHLALAHLYYNYARACYEAQNWQRSEQLIQNVESILTVHHGDEGESTSLGFLRSKVSSLRQDMQSKH
eukprot:gene12196-8723_t